MDAVFMGGSPPQAGSRSSAPYQTEYPPAQPIRVTSESLREDLGLGKIHTFFGTLVDIEGVSICMCCLVGS